MFHSLVVASVVLALGYLGAITLAIVLSAL
jgi:hypothetical protein